MALLAEPHKATPQSDSPQVGPTDGGASQAGVPQAGVPQAGTSLVVEKALDCLLALADSAGEVGVTELSRQLGQSKASVHRLLTALRSRNFVRLNPETRRYSLDVGVLRLSSALARQTNLHALALPTLVTLRDMTRETASLTVRRGNQRLHLEQVESIEDLRFTLEVGNALPLLVGASGKALVAWLPESEVDALIGTFGLPALAPGSITDRAAFKADLARIRARGFAVSFSERYVDVISVAAPVRDRSGAVVAAVNITGPASRCTPDQAMGFGPLVAAEAGRLSASLGWVARSSADPPLPSPSRPVRRQSPDWSTPS
ncbi:MAG: IclR family transcriptional regulator [Chloroflexi bacterium]|nr:IclR family transcriptional regulator [Chloroflexota bacterium]